MNGDVDYKTLCEEYEVIFGCEFHLKGSTFVMKFDNFSYDFYDVPKTLTQKPWKALWQYIKGTQSNDIRLINPV